MRMLPNRSNARLFEGCDASKYSSVCSAFDETGIEIFGTDFLAKYNDFER